MNTEKYQILDSANKDDVSSLVEAAFNYKEPHKFSKDFIPLFKKEFNPGTIAAFHQQKLVGHIGYCLRKLIINNESYNVAFIGGIAVDQAHRGRGLFRLLMDQLIIKLDNKVSFYLLWSGDVSLYEKFSFKECGAIYQWGEDLFSPNGEKVAVESLNDTELSQMAKLYETCWPNRVTRTWEQWQALKIMTSVELFITKDNNEIIEYSLVGKGFDLSGIAHEYAASDLNQYQLSHKDQLVWSPQENLYGEKQKKLWLAMAKTGAQWCQKEESIEQLLNNNEVLIGGIDSI